MNDLNLSNIGDLDRECKDLIPSLVNSLVDSKAKAKLSITIELHRMEDSQTAVIVSYSVKPTYPKRAQKMLCRADLTGNLKVDEQNQLLLMPAESGKGA